MADCCAGPEPSKQDAALFLLWLVLTEALGRCLIEAARVHAERQKHNPAGSCLGHGQRAARLLRGIRRKTEKESVNN